MNAFEEEKNQTKKSLFLLFPETKITQNPNTMITKTIICLLVASIIIPSLSTAAKLDISLDSSLYASNPNLNWTSPNTLFAFSFIHAHPQSDTYIAAVLYTGAPPAPPIPIWSAAEQVDSGGILHFLSTGVLRLVNGSGATIWETPTANFGVSSASLDDSGNFELNNETATVWSSFDNPTDTVIQTQNFTFGKILKSGFYSFTLLKTGDLNLTWNDSLVYWTNEFNSSLAKNLSSPRLVLQSNGTLSIFDESVASEVTNVAYSNDFGEGSDPFRFWRLDSDGNLRIYSTDVGNGNLIQRWAAVSDQCQVFGYCGNMGFCSYNDFSAPICQCPSENFEFIDENDPTKGCRTKIELETCVKNSTMLELKHVEVFTYQLEASQHYKLGIEACRSNCLGSSSCVFSTSMSDGSGSCYMKTQGFISGYSSPALPSTSFVKICGPEMPNRVIMRDDNNNCWRLRAWIAAFSVSATLLMLLALVGGLWWWFCRHNPKYGTLKYMILEYASGVPVQFSYKELHRITKGFNEKLGMEGFGAAYKGILDNKTIVAVKKLERIEQGERQFRMEVATISSTHHLNLVRLIGFCSEGRHRLLVYEYMKNGSLDSFLFEDEQLTAKTLNWEQRFNIALGTARGITYLHEECRDCIIHCDIKPENILLDEKYISKVSDFGLAKLLKPKEHRHQSFLSVRGARGYLAPEWLSDYPITSKSDVYGYGMVLLEIVSGRRNFQVSAERNWKKFSVWAYEEFNKGNLKGIIDERLVNDDVDMEQVMRAVQVSFWCTQEKPCMRPSMGKVFQMLEGIVEIEQPPPPMVVALAVSEGSIVGINWTNSNSLASPTISCSTPSALLTPGREFS